MDSARRGCRSLGVLALMGGLALGAAPLEAQASAPVPLDDPAYPLLDRLLARLPLETAFHGQRPYTRRRFALLVREAASRWAAQTGSTGATSVAGDSPDALLSALQQRFRPELAALEGADRVGGPLHLDRARLESSLADSRSRGIRPTLPGSVDNAVVNPLLGSRFGRELADGATLALEPELRLRLADRVVAFGGPRLALHLPRAGTGDGARDADLLVRTGAVRGTAGGWAVQVGRAELRRGQGRHAGALRSDDPPPLDMVLVESEEPFRLPWILEALGPATFSALLADLGADQNFPGATLYGSWLTVRPTRALELAGGYIVQSGGEGSPEQSFLERVADHLLFVDRLFRSEGNFEASNKVAGVEARLTLPRLVAYGELYLDDFRLQSWRRVGDMLWLDAGHVLGVSLPRLAPGSRLSGWLEYRHTGIRLYRHTQFTSGIASEGHLLGDPLGPDGQTLTGGVDLWAGTLGGFALEAAWETRSEDQWTSEGEPSYFVKAEDGPEEERYRAWLRWERRPQEGGFGWRIEAGGERVAAFDFEPGREEWNALLGVLLEWSPR